ncbi:carbohydrate sulfotransferase 4-like [Bufo gargarizans]|uniref:carbohydrate sulfotransferase 4-like n=1 Tax=Bufo gargarizans TaxID=30331 RepID=UPI001CF216B0|nr:carbohydrate sulfotransferase 4-like [Bufo gargarizans]
MWKVWGGKFSLIFLISAQTVGYIYLMMSLQYNKPPPPETKPERVHILILSTWRSGSSFTGQIFSQHPDVFYLMEPTWHVWHSLPHHSVKVLQMAVRDMVRSIFSCDMSVFDAYMPQNRLKSTLFQWETSRALCSPPACNVFGRGDIVSQNDCQKFCKLYPFDTVETSCHTYSHVVVKEVRFFSLKSLYPLFKDPSLNFKVLHLVRDPRAIFQSRERAAGELHSDNNIIMKGLSGNKSSDEDLPYRLMETICKSQVDIYLAATNGNHSGLDSRYMMVRYEDIVQNPIEKTRQMYEFGNLTFTPKLQYLIHNLTHGSGQGSKFVINSRDAVNVSRAWRKSLQFESVQRIQDVCAGAMEVFGYKSVKSQEAQNDLDYELLLPRSERVKKTSHLE